MTRLYQVPEGMREQRFREDGRSLIFYGVVVKVSYNGNLEDEDSIPYRLLDLSRSL